MGTLDGKVALVTGGSRGIGAATALRLAREGADVALTFTTSTAAAQGVADEITRLGRVALPLSADSADAADLRSAVRRVVDELGRLDILVNNAGVSVFGAVGSPAGEGLDLDTSDRQIDVNYRGVRNAFHAVVPLLSDHGRIISIGTATAVGSVLPASGEYTATKAAVTAYSRGAARDLGPRGITVNVVQPGPIATQMNPDEGEFAEFLTSRNALGRYGTTDEVAALVAFLAGPEAAFITGASITIDGGLAA